MSFRYLYLHGFASSSASSKGVALAEAFAEAKLAFERPDLNLPSFERLSIRAMLAHLDRAFESGTGTFRLVGSSLGGYLAARYAELHPERVDRLVLLCPGFHLAERWPRTLGEEWFAVWERQGELPFPDAKGVERPVHFGFVEEMRAEPGEPLPTCPTLVIHGTRDEVVPIRSSREFVAHARDAQLVEVDDVHDLARSKDRIVAEVMRFFDVGRQTLDDA